MPFLLSAEAVEILAAILGALATALGGAAGAGLFEKLSQIFLKKRLAGHASIILDSHELGAAPSGKSRQRYDIAKSQVDLRISEGKVAIARQVRLAKWGKISANSLTFGQYVIGGVMATSFAQKTLSPNVIGVFGVLVVVASIFKQHYHPDVTAQNALQRASQLEALIRQSEDRLVVIRATSDFEADNPSLLLELLERISAELSRITLTPSATSAARLPAAKRGK